MRTPVYLSTTCIYTVSLPPSASPDPFTEEETQRYMRRFEEGYDIKSDSRYNRWLQTHHPELPQSLFNFQTDSLF